MKFLIKIFGSGKNFGATKSAFVAPVRSARPPEPLGKRGSAHFMRLRRVFLLSPQRPPGGRPDSPAQQQQDAERRSGMFVAASI